MVCGWMKGTCLAIEEVPFVASKRYGTDSQSTPCRGIARKPLTRRHNRAIMGTEGRFARRATPGDCIIRDHGQENGGV